MMNNRPMVQRLCLTLATSLSLILAAWTAAADPFVPNWRELAPGVWAGVRDDNPRFPVMGTITFVVSDEGVVVFDGGGVPLMAERTIEKIRSLTNQPVTHVVISHWHGDHNFGIHPYLEQFPNVQVVAHSFTHAVMTGSRIRYIDGSPDAVPNYLTQIDKRLENGTYEDGTPLADFELSHYERVIADATIIHAEYQRLRVTVPNLTFDDKLTIRSGDRVIELLYLGDGNTAGDIHMWLPDEKIIATGDTVVHPVPYGFNVPPRRWVETLQSINALEYEILVPGHGEIQRNTAFVDLLIETAEGIADQRDALLAEGVATEVAAEKLDFSAYEERFTGGSDYYARFFEAWFSGPFRAAAMKALTGEPMVTPDTEPN